MTLPVAGGPIGTEEGGLPLLQPDQEASPPGEEAPKDQLQAKEETFTKADVEKLIEDARQEVRVATQKDINQIRSDLTRAQNEERKTWQEQDDAYQNEIHGLRMKDMDDATRAVYERDIERERATILRQRLDTTEEQLTLALQTGQYIQGIATAFGVELKDLDMTDMSKLSETMYEAAADKHQEALQEIDTLRGQLTEVRKSGKTGEEPEPGLPEAPDVVTQKGKAPPSYPSLLDLRKSLSADPNNIISEETLFELAERPDETGVDLNVVLQAVKAELEKTELLE